MPTLEQLKAAFKIESALAATLDDHLARHPDTTEKNLYTVGHQATTARAGALGKMIRQLEER